MGVSMNGLQIMETLRIQGVENRFFAQWSGHHSKTLNTHFSFARSRQLLAIVPIALNALSVVSVLCVGAFLVLNSSLSIGALFAFFTIDAVI